MSLRNMVLLVAAMGTLALAVGCAPNVRDMSRRLTSIDMVTKKSPDATYVVDPPDAIKVEFLNEPSNMTRTLALRTDGCVTLPYLEDVKVGGLTPIQIREKLEKLYARYYREPRILVTVTNYASKHVYLYGEVGHRGSLPYKGSMTVMGRHGSGGRVHLARRGLAGEADSP